MQVIRIPHSPENATPRVREALASIRRGEPARLEFEPGEYHFFADGAVTREFYPSNNDGGVKTVAIPLFGFSDLTLDGCGSVFVFHGRISPIILFDCTRVTLTGFTVDCGDPGYCQATILETDDDHTLLKINRDEFPYRVENGTWFFRREYDEVSTAVSAPLLQEFDAKVTGPAWGQGFVFLYTGNDPVDFSAMPFPVMRMIAQEAGADTVRLTMAETGRRWHRFRAGNELILKYENRENPAIFVYDCTDVSFSDVTLWRSLGMGIIAETSENLTLDRVRAITKPGRTGLVGVGDDATHFVNCSGQVTIRDCVFEHMMDDAVNIHGIYAPVESVFGNTVTVRLKHGQQKGVNIWKPGDTAELEDSETLCVLARPRVVSSVLSNDKTAVTLTFDAPVPDTVRPGALCENEGRSPDVLITGCRTGHNRPRGILMTSSGHAVIEHNLFYNSQTGIEVCGDAGFWYESGRVRDLTVRNNTFRNCCYNGGDYAIFIYPGFSPKGTCYHRNITVENNLFESFGPGMVYAKSVDGLTVRNNRWVRTDAFPPHTDAELTNFFEDCEHVTEENNTFTR